MKKVLVGPESYLMSEKKKTTKQPTMEAKYCKIIRHLHEDNSHR